MTVFDAYIIGFYVLSTITVAAAVMVVFSRNPLVSALYLALSFIGSAGLFIFLKAEFLALVQVLIYAGAIVVLFIYVIMLLDLAPERVKGVYGIIAKTFVASLLVLTALLLMFNILDLKSAFPVLDPDYTYTVVLASHLFSTYVVPFELVSIVLMIGIIGAVMLVKKIEKKGDMK